MTSVLRCSHLNRALSVFSRPVCEMVYNAGVRLSLWNKNEK